MAFDLGPSGNLGFRLGSNTNKDVTGIRLGCPWRIQMAESTDLTVVIVLAAVFAGAALVLFLLHCAAKRFRKYWNSVS